MASAGRGHPALHQPRFCLLLLVVLLRFDLLVFFALTLVVFRLVHDRDQLDLKDQRLVGSNRAVGTSPFTVSQARRNKELPLRSYRHELQRLGPPFDHLTDSKRRRLSALVGAVKFRAIDERAAIITINLIAGRGLRSDAGGQWLPVQAAR